MNAVHHLTLELSEACVQNHNLRSTLEECKKSRDGLINRLTAVVHERDEAIGEVELLKKELHTQKKIAEMRKASAHRLDSVACASVGTLYGEICHLRAELKAEHEAHNKLKALCNERGFGTPLFYTPPTKPIDWSVEFHTKHQGTIKM